MPEFHTVNDRKILLFQNINRSKNNGMISEAAFQIIHRLWKSKTKKRILFLADRNALIAKAQRNDFHHFKDKMTVNIINFSYT